MNRTERILSRIAQGFLNSKELFSKHPLLAWRLISHDAKGRRFFREIVSGGNIGLSTTNDGWKDLGKHLKDKIWHHFMK